MLADKLRSAAPSFNPAWDLAYAYYDPPENLTWDIGTATYIKSFSVASTGDLIPQAVFFKPDGSSMYILGSASDRVTQYTLSTAWDISTASFLQHFIVGAQESNPTGLFFKPDGLSMYIVGSTGDDVNQYTLSTAWDISTASFLQVFSVSGQDTFPTDIFFKPDGLSMYIVGDTGDDVNQYTLSTAWDISTASYLQSFSVAAQDTTPSGIFFKPDGLSMYIVGDFGNDINQYTLSTAWDISTASYLKNFSVNSFETSPTGIFFKPDGSAMYVIGSSSDLVLQYALGGFTAAGTTPFLNGLFFKPDGLSMYTCDSSQDVVRQYSLSTAWDLGSASYLQLLDISAQETSSQGIFFKPDGTNMYIVGNTGDEVNQYTLSTAWDISTASFLQLLSVAAQDTLPSGIFFKPDGLVMYISGDEGDDINQYTLSTAWDISTASFLQNFSVAAQETTPTDIFFKPNGLVMYVLGTTGDDVNEYALSTAWDISTAVFVQNFSTLSQELTPQSIFFKPDGTRMYIAGPSSDKVFQYSFGIQE